MKNQARLFHLAFVSAGLAGLGLRLFSYLRDPSMWHDEAAGVLNVLKHNNLTGSLYLSSTTSPLLLLLQRTLVTVLGDGTYALRLSSLVASCGGLLLFMGLARRLLPPAASLIAVVLVAFSDRLLWHTAEARHYSVDFFLAAMLFYVTLRISTWPTSSRTALFLVLLPLVIFSSYPGVFLAGGVVMAWYFNAAGRPRRELLALIIVAAAVAAAFLLFHQSVVRWQRTPVILDAWAEAFPDWKRPWLLPWWFITSMVAVIDYSARPIGGILIIPAVIGTIWWWRHDGREVVIHAATPILLAAAAALVHAYPFTGARTMVFAMPGLVLLIAAGTIPIMQWSHRTLLRQILAGVLLLAPVAAVVLLSVGRLLVPSPRPDVAGAAAFVLEQRRADEPVTGNDWTHEYYFRELAESFTPRLALLEQEPSAGSYWVVLTAADGRERDRLARTAMAQRRIIARREFEGTTVLYLAQGIKDP